MKPPTEAYNAYKKLKTRYPEHVLFFRLGSHYELFGDDAKKVAEICGLTVRHNKTLDTDMAGVPVHSVDLYVKRVIQAGFHVAKCEETDNPTETKRDVVRLTS